MSTADIAQIIAIAASAIAVGALVLLFLLFKRIQELQAQQKVILGPKGVSSDIIAYIGSLTGRIDKLRDAVDTLSLEARDHEVRIDGCVSRIGMVRFDAYSDLGGRQSTAIGLMNAKDDGIVITTVVSRDFARTYVKLIKEGRPDVPLAPEEEEALEQARARGSAPFTLRPRPAPADKEAVEEAAVVPLVDTVDEDQIALERENRRRRRQGLPPLEYLPDRDDLGWPDLNLDTPDDESSAPDSLEALRMDEVFSIDPRTADTEPVARRHGRSQNEEPNPFDNL
ncbi:MAG: DUF4446 family protein [Actinobacteria bacterium]|nr:DUF4446 family protein [Actinomycetota bacterium]